MDTHFDLVRRAQAGDEFAAQSLVDKNYPAVYRLALSILDDPVEAEQVAREAGTAQLENLDAYPGPEGYTAWLYRITLQVCRKRLRADSMQEMLRRLPLMRQKDGPGEPPVKTVEEPDRLVWAAAQLEEKQRLVLVLRYGHELLPAEIGQVLNWRESSVQARLAQARQSLRTILKMHDPFEAQFGPQSDLTHQQAEKYIEETADHAITDGDAARLARHLKECPRCVEAAQRLEKLENDLRAAFHERWMVENPPPAGEISAALDQRRQKRIRLRTLSLGGGVLFTLLVIGLILYLPGLYPARPAAALPAAPRAVKATPTEDNVYVLPDLPQGKDPINNRDLLARVYPGKLAFIGFALMSDHLFTFQPGTRDFNQLTTGFADDSLPAWSPDGQLVAYLSVPGGASTNQVYLANADGSHIHALPTPNYFNFIAPAPEAKVLADPISPLYGAPHWSPDGQWLAMAVWANSSRQFLVVQSVMKTVPPRLLPVEDIDLNYLAWSPDGNALAYVAGSQHQLYVWWPFEAVPRPNPLWMSPLGAWDEVFGLAWSPDSDQLAIVGGLRDRDVMQVDLHLIVVSDNRWRSIPVSKGVLTRSPTRSSNLAWSPDGRYLAFTPVFTDSQLKYGRIMLIPMGKDNPVPLVGVYNEISSITWSPDGQWLAYSTGYEMWVASIAAYESGQPPLAQLSGTSGSDLSWQPLPK